MNFYTQTKSHLKCIPMCIVDFAARVICVRHAHHRSNGWVSKYATGFAIVHYRKTVGYPLFLSLSRITLLHRNRF